MAREWAGLNISVRVFRYYCKVFLKVKPKLEGYKANKIAPPPMFTPETDSACCRRGEVCLVRSLSEIQVEILQRVHLCCLLTSVIPVSFTLHDNVRYIQTIGPLSLGRKLDTGHHSFNLLYIWLSASTTTYCASHSRRTSSYNHTISA